MAVNPTRLSLVALIVLGACSRHRGVDPHLDGVFPDRLSGWGLFAVRDGRLVPAGGVMPYELNTTLFSDYADKSRTVWMPAGRAAGYRAAGVLELPVGTILTKTFAFPRDNAPDRLVETRLLVRQPGGWVALEYVWDRDQSDAKLEVSPAPVPIEHGGRSFDYRIPNVNQCGACHETGAPLGPTARNLNRGDQLARWVKAGYLGGVPPAGVPRAPVWDDPRTGPAGDRVRAYLDVNCGSCHRPATKASRTGYLLRAQDPAPARCQADTIITRMETLDSEKTMPVLGHDVVHREAVSLIREWAATLKPCYNR